VTEDPGSIPGSSTDEAPSLWFELGALPRWNCVRCV